jgi:transketolase
MRNSFASELLELMWAFNGVMASGWKWKDLDRGKYDGVALLLGDVGYGVFDKVREKFPGWVINCGAAEHTMLAMAVGMAIEKRMIVFAYTITPFLLWRGAEVIRNYIHHEEIPVKLVGSGRWREYEKDGYSHCCLEDIDLLRDLFYNIETYRPQKKEDIPKMFQDMVTNGKPSYMNLSRY